MPTPRHEAYTTSTLDPRPPRPRDARPRPSRSGGGARLSQLPRALQCRLNARVYVTPLPTTQSLRRGLP